jgi:hypothetical protein
MAISPRFWENVRLLAVQHGISKDLVDVVKQPSEKMGLGRALKEKISSFIKSEG